MLALSSAIIEEKNKIASTGAWLLLLQVDVSGEDTIRLALNTEDIAWNGHTWQAFPFSLDEISEDGQGSLPSFTIRVCNVDNAMQTVVDAHDGAVGSDIRLLLIHGDHLTETSPVFDEKFEILAADSDHQWVYFQVGGVNPLNRRCPAQRYMMNHCRYRQFKGALCGYSGSAGECDRTFATCKALGNAARFGGFPGISQSQGVYL